MTKIKLVKIGALVGALITGASMAAGGNVEGGLGVILSALSSAGAFSAS